MAKVNEQAVKECVTAIESDIAKQCSNLDPWERLEVLERLQVNLESMTQSAREDVEIAEEDEDDDDNG